jgi:aminoglycoside 2'-N-acetyltransferase I
MAGFLADKAAIRLIRSGELTAELEAEILTMCNRAFEEDLQPLFRTFTGATHVVAVLEGAIVSHAMWVTRWLQLGDEALLRTAYVEMVATDPRFERRGLATSVMQHLAKNITDFDLGALCPAEPGLYLKLGWVFWRGPLFIRQHGGLLTTSDERVMVLALPRTPRLDLDAPLSAEWRAGELW